MDIVLVHINTVVRILLFISKSLIFAKRTGSGWDVVLFYHSSPYGTFNLKFVSITALITPQSLSYCRANIDSHTASRPPVSHPAHREQASGGEEVGWGQSWES